MPMKICPTCGANFFTTHSKSIGCSNECKIIRNNEKLTKERDEKANQSGCTYPNVAIDLDAVGVQAQ